jgi:hypothetical protein
MKKIPGDIGAKELINLLGKTYNYTATRQTGSHIGSQQYKTVNITLQYRIIIQLN